MKNSDKVENVIIKHQKYWRASKEYVDALDELNGVNGLDCEGMQRLRVVQTKLMADRCQIELEINRIVEKLQ